MENKIIAVTNRHLSIRPFLEQIERVCQMHPEAIILREKDLTEEEYFTLSVDVLDICKKYDVACIFHSFPEVAVRLSVPRIHLPLWKLRETKRELLKEFEIVGSSVHSIEEAQEAERLGATYITAGHVYATDCKKGLPPRGTEFLSTVCQSVDIPVYGIGGIGLDEIQIREVKVCGAEGVCIMSEMMRI